MNGNKVKGQTCAVDACDKPVAAQRVCSMHYQRMRNTGELQAIKGIIQHGTITGYSAYGCRCEPCSAANVEVRRRRKARNPSENRNAGLRARYGITSSDYEAMLAEQHGACAICAIADDPTHPQRRLRVDHDHATGAIRGLLCHGCNVALGHLRDDPALVANALIYLTGSQLSQER